MFLQETHEGITVYKSPVLKMQQDLLHGFSSRLGGYSLEPFYSLNMGLTSGDNPEHVVKNRSLFARAAGIMPEQVVCGYQVHSTNIARVTLEDAGRGFFDASQALTETDGMITSQKGIALMTLYADCVPVLFYEPEQKVIAVCHCGWKGTVGKLAAKMAGIMKTEYGCNLEKILAAIGPSISQKAYEVDQPVLERFRDAFSFADKLITPVDAAHGKVDLWEANRLQLLEAGLLDCNIDVSGLCTCQNNHIFFSHRADHGKTGRNAALLMMK